MGFAQVSRRNQLLAASSIPVCLFVLYVMSLVGCISDSPGVPDIFLVKLQDTKTNATVNVGYFGICAGTGWTLTCQPTFSSNLNSTLNKFPTNDASLRQLLLLGQDIQQKIIVFVPLVIGGLLLLSSVVSLIIWRWPAESKASSRLGQASVTLTNYSLAGAVGAASAVTMASSALRFAGTSLSNTGSNVVATGGTTLQTLQWMIVIFTMLWHLVATVVFK